MIYLVVITVILTTISLIKDRKKTLEGMKLALKRLKKILFPLTAVLILVSFALYFLPEKKITDFLSNGNRYLSVLLALFFGSITMMPGFIVFPLSGILKDNGVLYMVISAFTTTLMMVGILTFPVEKKYFGTKVALIRNIVSFFSAVIIALVTGILFGELA